MEKTNCKRCGRALRSQESIKRGYGPKCFKITQLQEKTQETKITSEIDFLKCEINMIKRQLRQSQNNIIVHKAQPIEKINRDEHRPERNLNKANFSVVIKELKDMFTQGDPRKMLMHVPREEIKIC
ncbi:MAG: DUF6011 domain-containing protein [Promethearchaeota archaeon]